MSWFKDVDFYFLSAADAETAEHNYRGTVIIRENEMVLEVELPGDEPYLIKGKTRDGFYEGDHEGMSGDIPVHAKWTRLDRIWIGTWLEDGYESLFTFRLPSAA